MSRKYSVEEIDRMRRAVEYMVMWGEKIGTPWPEGVSSRTSGTFSGNEVTERTEARLRTYLLAGTDPEELEYQPAPVVAEDVA